MFFLRLVFFFPLITSRQLSNEMMNELVVAKTRPSYRHFIHKYANESRDDFMNGGQSSTASAQGAEKQKRSSWLDVFIRDSWLLPNGTYARKKLPFYLR